MLDKVKVFLLGIGVIISLIMLGNIISDPDLVMADDSINSNATSSEDTTRNDKTLRCVPVSPSCGCYLYTTECRNPGYTWHITGSCGSVPKWTVQGGTLDVFQYGTKAYPGVPTRCQVDKPAELTFCGTTCTP